MVSSFLNCFTDDMCTCRLGGGYLFGLPVGFVADSIGATIGATAAFLLGRTIGKPYVISKLKDYPKFQAVAIAIQRSGFKPITFALVYVGTTLKDITDVTHGWSEVSTSRWLSEAPFIKLEPLVMIFIIISSTSFSKLWLSLAVSSICRIHEERTINYLTMNKLPPISEGVFFFFFISLFSVKKRCMHYLLKFNSSCLSFLLYLHFSMIFQQGLLCEMGKIFNENSYNIFIFLVNCFECR
ncbi:hypothetical protein IHE45_12G030000 [Dioscorea alata]|uniref:Uncharacterized protein n=1 Tax=Dioscorea alata TaxID=55571 RepID=A0ACB7V0Y5_DIOAL|nr:hypothetical protein IHE45_12G030000 [Dioscorea alata]